MIQDSLRIAMVFLWSVQKDLSANSESLLLNAR
jgi:hypothetical protein